MNIMAFSQDLEKKPLLLHDQADVESQRVGNVHYVSMSMPAFLAWNLLSFLLGILTTVLVIWMLMGCEKRRVRGGYYALGP